MQHKSVIFQKPNLPSLIKQGYTCIDAHTHTNYSDGYNLSLVLKQCRKKGIGIAITDHNEIRGVIEASKQKEVAIIPGIEINTSDGPHFLCYFYNVSELQHFYEQFIAPKKFFNMKSMVNITLLDAIDRLEKFSCVTCLPHPYAPMWANLNRVLVQNPENRKAVESVDAIEVISGLQRKDANRKAHALQILLDKAPMGGSDAHGISDLGNCLTLTETKNANDFLDAVRKKKTIAIGKERIRQKAVQLTRMLRKNSKRIRVLLKNKILSENETV